MKKVYYYSALSIVCTFALAQSEQKKISDFFVTSIPKSGTHLIDKCLSLLTGKTHLWVYDPERMIKGKLPEIPHDKYLMYHMRYNEKVSKLLRKHNMPVIFTVRDPRDQVVSMTFWKLTRPEAHPEKAAEFEANPSFFSNYLMKRIKNVTRYYKSFLAWQKDPSCHTVKFENLVGDEGGGSDSAQIREIQKIAAHCRIPLTNQKLKYCRKNLFGGTTTFRKGHIGGWKKYFTSKHKRAFKKLAGQLLIDLGYEKNFDW